MKTVHVAAGIIHADDGSDRVLAAQRGYGDMKGLWEFPGGKVTASESAADACRRELAEELQVKVGDLRSFYTVEYDYPDFHLSMECFFCRIEEGTPTRSDRQLDLKWVSRRSLASLTWMPADRGLIDLLANADEGEDASGADAAPSDADATASDADDDAAGGASGKKAAPTRAKRAKRAAKRKRAKAKPDLLDGVNTSDLTIGETKLVRKRAAVRKSMLGNRGKNTKPELVVRQRLREAGLTGYRLHWSKVPGRPDIAFPGRKIAIFVNGCFWHRCPHCHPKVPKTNTEFWEAKFRRNVERDQEAYAALKAMGWQPVVIWECQLKPDKIDAIMGRLISLVRAADPHQRDA